MTFIKFILAGGSGAVANISSRYLFNLFMPFSIAIALAYIVGMITTFILSKLFVFETKEGKAKSEAFRFVIVNIFALAIVWAVSMLLAEIIFPVINFNFYP
ncbi:MAG: GtrA family protein, partial [Lentilitoribacter sp.]